MEIKQFIEENIENMKADLAKLVSYNSVNSNDELPFGSNNRKVLDEAEIEYLRKLTRAI